MAVLLKVLSCRMWGNYFESCALYFLSILKYYSNSATFYKYKITKLKKKKEILPDEVISVVKHNDPPIGNGRVVAFRGYPGGGQRAASPWGD